MKISELRKKGQGVKDQIGARTKESYNVKDDSGKYGSIFNKKMGLEKYKIAEGEHAVDIIPWLVGNQYPTKNFPNIKPGDIAYILDIWVHFGIGVNEDAIACPARNYDKPCPVCEELTQLKKEGADDELINPLKPKRRAIYQVVSRNSAGEEAKGVQLMDSPHYYTERIIAEKARRPFGGGFIFFSDPDEGKTVYFKRKGTGRSTEYVSHDFMDRKEPISDEILDSALSLDDYLVIKDYDEIKALHEGANLYTEAEEKPAEEKEEKQVDKERKEEQQAEEQKAEQPPAEEKSATTRRRAPLGQDKKNEEASGPQTCPGGGVFAQDIDTLDHCPECDKWEDCAKAAAGK